MKLDFIKGQTKTTTLQCKERNSITGALSELDVSGATEITVHFSATPDSSSPTVSKTYTGSDITFTSDGTDGQITFTMSDSNTDRTGTLFWAVKVVTSTATWYSEIGQADFRKRLASFG